MQGHSVRNLQIGIENGVSVLTKEGGLAQLALAAQHPSRKDLAIVRRGTTASPRPLFADNSENLIKIVAVKRGDRAALECGAVVASLAAKVKRGRANVPSLRSATPIML